MSTLNASTHISYGPDPRQCLDVWVPHAALEQAESPLLVLLHGGWWSRGARQDVFAAGIELCQRGHAVASLGYRMLQGSRNGLDLINDLVDGLRVTMEEYQLLGGRRSLVLVGSGAGGLLAFAALPALRAAQLAQICGLAMLGTAPGLKPWPDCPPAIADCLQRFAAHEHLHDILEKAMQMLPAVLLLHSDADQEVPCSLARQLHASLRERELPSRLVVISGDEHRFLENPMSHAGRSACKHLSEWVSHLDSQYNKDQDPLIVGEPSWLQS